MVKLYWMIGISGSGKSTLAEELAKNENAFIVSSDKIRKELYGDENIQGDPNVVFERVHNRILTYLNTGFNVIYDATNITLKNRIKMFNFLKEKNVTARHIAVVLTASLGNCLSNNRSRDRFVPEDVIIRQYKSFNIPFFEEGFDEIILDGYFENKGITKNSKISNCDFNYMNLMSLLLKMGTFNQNNPHHNKTLGEHCVLTYLKLKEYSDDKSLLYAALLHDVGKLYTKTTDDKGVSHFFNHSSVGCHTILQNLDIFCLSPLEVINTLFYINYHMLPFDWGLAKTKDKYNKIFGNEKFNNLLLLNKIDKDCSID